MRTDKLLLIGMALTSDKAERRIRGVFSKKRTSALARIALIILSLCLLLLCFTSACQPKVIDELVERGGGVLPAVQESVTPGDASSAEEGDGKKLSVYADTMLRKNYPGLSLAMLRSIKDKLPDYEVTFYDPTGGDSTMSLNDQMTRLSADLLVGKGPDIIIGSSIMFNGVYGSSDGGVQTLTVGDLGKQMVSGAYVDLLPYMESDENFDREDYFTNVLDGAMINGKLCGLPLTFSYNGATTCGDALAATGLDITREDSLDIIITKLEAYLSKGGERQAFDGAGLISTMLLPTVVTDMYDYSDGRIELDGDLIKRIVDIDKQEKSCDTHDYFDDADHGLKGFMEGKYVFCYNGRLIDAVMSHTAVLEPHGGAAFVPFRNMSGGITARIEYFGLINTGTKNVKLAYDCLMTVAEAMQSSNGCTCVGIPVMRKYAKKLISADSGIVVKSMYETPGWEATKLPQEFFDYYLSLADEVTSVTISAEPVGILYKAFMPYIDGDKSFGECFEQAEYDLMLFLSE